MEREISGCSAALGLCTGTGQAKGEAAEEKLEREGEEMEEAVRVKRRIIEETEWRKSSS